MPLINSYCRSKLEDILAVLLLFFTLAVASALLFSENNDGGGNNEEVDTPLATPVCTNPTPLPFCFCPSELERLTTILNASTGWYKAFMLREYRLKPVFSIIPFSW